MESRQLSRQRRAAFLSLAGGLAAALGLLLPAGVAARTRPFAVVDLHVDLAYQSGYRGRSFAEGTGQVRAAELSKAGVVGVVLPLFVPRQVTPRGPRRSDLEASYARVFGALATTEPYRLPGCIPRHGGVRTWLAFEGAGPLAGEPDALVSWAARGVRLVGLVHTWQNELASSSGDRQPAQGLSAAGRELVQRAHALGMFIDVSHASDRAVRDVIALAEPLGMPVVATHSNARALADHPRNLADAELRAIARTGGVVGVNFHGPFVRRGGNATLADVVRHVLHLVRVMGPAHVAIGADFEGDTRPPSELADVRGYQRLASALEAAGMPVADVEGVMSRNALRVLCRAGDLER